MHHVYLPGCPSVALSSTPGTAPVTLMMTSRIARPIVAFALCPGPNTLTDEFIARSFAIGPFTTASTAAPIVLTVIACRLNCGSTSASTAASTTGKYSGRHPAITALIATFSAVITRPLVGSVPRISEGDSPA